MYAGPIFELLKTDVHPPPIFAHISKSIHQLMNKNKFSPYIFFFFDNLLDLNLSQCSSKDKHFIATLKAQNIAIFHISGVGVHSPINKSGMVSHWLNRQIDFLVNTCSYSCSSEDLSNTVVKELCIITTRVTQASHVSLRPVLEVQTH